MNWVTLTVLADGRETLFELPAGPADEREWFEDFDGLRCVYDTFRVKRWKPLDAITSSDALGKVYDVLVGTCERKSV
jgi:hypothetical protein